MSTKDKAATTPRSNSPRCFPDPHLFVLPYPSPAAHLTSIPPPLPLKYSTDSRLESREEEEEKKPAMAGLGVLLEGQPPHRPAQIISKTSFLSKSPPSSAPSGGGGTFLERCFLCRRKLQQGKDIYMYRGDRGFCSEECRRRQMFMDEETGGRMN